MELTLDELKKQARVEWDEEDDLLTLYGQAACEAVLRYTGRREEDLIGLNAERTGQAELPKAVTVAALMLAAHWYRTREAVSGLTQAVVPYGIEWLLRPWTKLTH